MTKLKVEYVDLKDIQTYENNAKIHTGEQIEQIKKSIEEFGFNDPIAVWNGTIVEGHGRYIAATELGMEHIPVIRLDSLTDEQRRAYTLIHNKLTMNTGFDFDILEEELEDLQNIEMGAYGFDFQKMEEEMNTEIKEAKMRQGTFQIIVDCDSEEHMEHIYNELTQMGIECRTSAL